MSESPTSVSAPEKLRKDVEQFDKNKLKDVEEVAKTPSQTRDMTMAGNVGMNEKYLLCTFLEMS